MSSNLYPYSSQFNQRILYKVEFKISIKVSSLKNSIVLTDYNRCMFMGDNFLVWFVNFQPFSGGIVLYCNGDNYSILGLLCKIAGDNHADMLQ